MEPEDRMSEKSFAKDSVAILFCLAAAFVVVASIGMSLKSATPVINKYVGVVSER